MSKQVQGNENKEEGNNEIENMGKNLEQTRLINFQQHSIIIFVDNGEMNDCVQCW